MMAHLNTCLMIVGAIFSGLGLLAVTWGVILWVTKG